MHIFLILSIFVVGELFAHVVLANGQILAEISGKNPKSLGWFWNMEIHNGYGGLSSKDSRETPWRMETVALIRL